MARIDALYLEDPTTGSRRTVQYLAREGIPISRDSVRNLMRHMGLRAIYQRPRTTVPGSPSERFPCLVDLQRLTAPDQVWVTVSPTFRCGRASCTWWPLSICSHGMFSAGNSPTALTRNSAWKPWTWRWGLAASHRSSIPTKDASSPPRTSWQGCKPRKSGSAGPEGNAAMTTSWWKGCGAQSSTPGSPGELPPEAPTDPYVTLSRHTAPVIQPPPVHHANEQTSQAAAGRSAPEAHDCGDAFAVIVGASDAAMRSAPD